MTRIADASRRGEVGQINPAGPLPRRVTSPSLLLKDESHVAVPSAVMDDTKHARAAIAAAAHLSQLSVYLRHCRATAAWLLQSVRHGRGGSSAYYAPGFGWSAPYPETTGYIIPTLLALQAWVEDRRVTEAAHDCGRWLLSIQAPEGYWRGGLHSRRSVGRPSVFNTAQGLRGMVALYETTGKSIWAAASARAANWMAEGIGSDRLWRGQDYRAARTPTYYSYAAAAMLQAWRISGDNRVRAVATGALDALLERKTAAEMFDGWSFEAGRSAFTHTIAYTLQGFLESAAVLGTWTPYGQSCVRVFEILLRRAELRGGQLPGAYADGWTPTTESVCLTGNAQVALCLLDWERREHDLRIVNGAAKLVDVVCRSQRTQGRPSNLVGAVAGSSPLWGPYMRFRYPNWAAKYQADALMALMRRLAEEL